SGRPTMIWNDKVRFKKSPSSLLPGLPSRLISRSSDRDRCQELSPLSSSEPQPAATPFGSSPTDKCEWFGKTGEDFPCGADVGPPEFTIPAPTWGFAAGGIACSSFSGSGSGAEEGCWMLDVGCWLRKTACRAAPGSISCSSFSGVGSATGGC